MKYKSPLISQGSGGVAGCVFSHNRFGAYIRNRTVPTNPLGAEQVRVRQILAGLATGWLNDLTSTQREAWTVYGNNVPKIDALGQTFFSTGLNWYIAVNQPRLNFNKPRIDDAPTIFTHAELNPVVITGNAGDQEVSVTFNNTDSWAGAVGGFLYLYIAPPQNQSIFFHKSPFRGWATINGAVVPPTSPAVVAATKASPYTLASGSKLFVRAMAQTSDGRISPPQIVSGGVSP